MKEYLGDAVYVDMRGDTIKLTTEDGRYGTGPTNLIYLEPEVYAALVAYVNSLKIYRRGG